MRLKIPNLGNLATTTTATYLLLLPLLLLKMKYVNNVNNLVYNTKTKKIGKKITDHDHDKCITTQEFSKLKSECSQ